MVAILKNIKDIKTNVVKMPKIHITKNYIRKRIVSPKKFDKRSFRIKKISKNKKIIVACPKGKFKKNRCSVGMKLQAILTKK